MCRFVTITEAIQTYKKMSFERPLKVVAFNGSSHPKGNTTRLIEAVFEELRKEGIECEMVPPTGPAVQYMLMG